MSFIKWKKETISISSLKVLTFIEYLNKSIARASLTKPSPKTIA